MGYYAKDGAYVFDDNDINVREANNETQGQAFDRRQRAIIDSKPLFTPEQEAAREKAYGERVKARADAYTLKNLEHELEEKEEKRRQKKEAQKKAYEAAKRRYKNLSAIQKLWLNITGKNIKHYNSNNNIETLNSLYGGKKRWI